MKINIKVVGLKPLQNYVSNIIKKLEALKDIISPVINKDIIEHFEKEETPTGFKWLPLSPKYKAWKIRHFGNLPMMVLKGTLKAGSVNPVSAKEDNIIYYHTVPYYFAMFVGKKQRHFYGLSEKAGDLIMQAIDRRINLD